MKNFSKLATPLTDLTKKGNFGWNEVAQKDFEELKENMSSCLVLAVPNISQPFQLYVMPLVKGLGLYLCRKNTLLLSRAGS